MLVLILLHQLLSTSRGLSPLFRILGLFFRQTLAFIPVKMLQMEQNLETQLKHARWCPSIISTIPGSINQSLSLQSRILMESGQYTESLILNLVLSLVQSHLSLLRFARWKLMVHLYILVLKYLWAAARMEPNQQLTFRIEPLILHHSALPFLRMIQVLVVR